MRFASSTPTWWTTTRRRTPGGSKRSVKVDCSVDEAIERLRELVDAVTDGLEMRLDRLKEEAEIRAVHGGRHAGL